MNDYKQKRDLMISPSAKEMYDYLSGFREEVPEWLLRYKPGDTISFQDIMSGRTSYYPGFWKDGSMLMTANMSHSVHSHIHLDYMNKYEEDIQQVNKIKGYHSIGHIKWTIEDILPDGRNPLNVDYKTAQRPDFFRSSKTYYFTEILERDRDKDDSHGAKRMAMTILCEDGIDFYYQLYVCQYKTEPWLFMLQDHGLGCNYDKFGKGGLLNEIIKINRCKPEFVICENGRGTEIWYGYKIINDVKPIVGGIHHNIRYLYRRKRVPKVKLGKNAMTGKSPFTEEDRREWSEQAAKLRTLQNFGQIN